MTTRSDLIRELTRSLRSAGLDVPDREARWIIDAAVDEAGSTTGPNQELDDGVVRLAEELAARRRTGEPLQYVTGMAGFRHLDLSVGPGVMVPRPETELLAQKAMDVLPADGLVVDVGTGSGAIALSIAKERPDATVIATDASLDAARWARRNIDSLALPVCLIACDLLSALANALKGRVQVVVANPPYVAADEAGSLPPEVVDHEPHRSLFAGAGGTEVLRRLIAEGPHWLAPAGWMVLEIGMSQGDLARALLMDRGFTEVSVERDLTGRERIASGRWPSG